MRLKLYIWMVFIVCLTMCTAIAQSDCRLKSKDLKPVIQPFNPYFTDHKWNDISKMESARLDDEQLIVISQHGCKRHHTVFSLFIPASQVVGTDSFWVHTVRYMMRATYFNSTLYRSFQDDFEETFSKKVSMYGVNNKFNFPLATRNFICEIQYKENSGAKIRIEMVDFVFSERVRKNQPSSKADDGWFKASDDQDQ